MPSDRPRSTPSRPSTFQDHLTAFAVVSGIAAMCFGLTATWLSGNWMWTGIGLLSLMLALVRLWTQKM